MGKFVGEVLGNIAVIAIFSSSAIFAALGFALFTSSSFPLVRRLSSRLRTDWRLYLCVVQPHQKGLLSQQLMAFRLLGILMLINISFSLLQDGPPLWVAELCGAVTGFISAAIIHPGGVRFIINKFRRS